MAAQVVPLISPKVDLPVVNEGIHNTSWDRSQDRILRGYTLRPLGTICVVPTRTGNLDYRFVNTINGMIKPPNHPYLLWLAANLEVGDAYNQVIWQILNNPGLMAWNGGKGPFILTVEEDNIVPADALVKLLAALHESPYAAISALYWTKGEGGCPQIWGRPGVFPPSMAPIPPIVDTLQECRGIGMGCAIWDIDQFKDSRTRQGMDAHGVPIWFKTWSELMPGGGSRVGTQDLSYNENAQKHGYRFAVDNRVRVGHIDYSSGVIW